jgi:hypothetical protein
MAMCLDRDRLVAHALLNSIQDFAQVLAASADPIPVSAIASLSPALAASIASAPSHDAKRINWI